MFLIDLCFGNNFVLTSSFGLQCMSWKVLSLQWSEVLYSSPSKSTTFQGFVYSNRITKDLHNWHCVKQSYLNGGSGENIIMIPPCMNYHATWFCVSVCREINCFNDSLVNTYELKCDFLWCGCANHLLTAGLLNNFSLKMDDGFGIAMSNIHYV